MAKTAKHDVFDMSDDIARIKRTKSVEVSDLGDSGNDLSYTTGKGSQRRVAKDTDKMVNVRVSKELHRRFRMESIDRDVPWSITQTAMTSNDSDSQRSQSVCSEREG